MSKQDDNNPRQRFVDESPKPVRKLRYPHAPPPNMLQKETTSNISDNIEPNARLTYNPLTYGNQSTENRDSSQASTSSNLGSSGDHVTAHHSVLSPLAVEFVPRQNFSSDMSSAPFYPNEQNRNYYSRMNYAKPATSVSDRLKVGRSNANTPEPFMKNRNVDSTRRFISIIDQLNISTANFDSVRSTMDEILNDCAGDELFLDRAAKLLLNEAVVKTNFHYSCARLSVIIDLKAPAFYSLVTEQCGRLYLQYEKDLVNDRNRSRMLGLLGVSCELLFNFFRERRMVIEQLGEFAQFIFKMMHTVLSVDVEKEKNVKIVCQALKLSGYYLQASSSSYMDKLLKRLRKIVDENGSNKISLYIQGIVNLSDSGWGYSEDSENTDDKEAEEDEASNSTSCLTDRWEYPDYNAEVSEIDDTVYYGPDGKVLTAEETSFLYCNLNNKAENEADENDGDDDALWDPENELDPEVHKAFKDFVQYSKNQSK